MFRITTSGAGEEDEANRNRRWSAWIQRAGKGDVDAFGALYDESSMVIFPMVLQILQDRQLAEDTLFHLFNHVREQAAQFETSKQDALDWLMALGRDFAVERMRGSGAHRS